MSLRLYIALFCSIAVLQLGCSTGKVENDAGIFEEDSSQTNDVDLRSDNDEQSDFNDSIFGDGDGGIDTEEAYYSDDGSIETDDVYSGDDAGIGTDDAYNSDDAGLTDESAVQLPPLSAEFIKVSWNYRQGALYSLDVKPYGSDFIGPCVDAGLLGFDRLSYLFDGMCPSSANYRIDSVERFRICTSIPDSHGQWNDSTVECTEQNYVGGARLHIESPETLMQGVELRWPSIPDADYCLHLHLRDGQVIINCADAGVIGSRNEFVFNGSCPSNVEHPFIALSDIRYFEINSAIHGQWTVPDARDKAIAAFDGSTRHLFLSFDKYRNYYFEETCHEDPSDTIIYDTGHTMTVHKCGILNSTYSKRRWVRLNEYSMMGYPRSFLDDDGQFYLLFSTCTGGFPPAGTPTGCPELNLVRTKDFTHFEFLSQIDRYCGDTRVENGEISIIGGKMYIVYNTFSPHDDCARGRTWQIRLKVSDSYKDSSPTFTDLGGNPAPEILYSQCISNESLDGFWEPYVYQTDPGELRIVFADDTPPEVEDNQCNQFIRMIRYSENQRRLISSEPIGSCPGDRRDGMPVVAKWPGGGYSMVFESLGAPANQIIMLTSNDGRTWDNRNIVADTRIDGGISVGCPYIRIYDDKIYVSYSHVFRHPYTNSVYSHFEIRALNSQLERIDNVVFEMRPRRTPNDIAHYFWGSINIVNDQIVGLGAGYPYMDSFIPLR